MQRSLTVLLPVRDAQFTLATDVAAILEVASELTDRLELVIVDDASADSTVEVAEELAVAYPQIRAVRHGSRLGREAAVQTGLKHSSGEIVLVRDASINVAADEIRRLWRQVCVGITRGNASVAAGSRPPRWIATHASHPIGYQVIDRGAEQRPEEGRPARPNYLARLRDFALGE